MVPRPLLGGGYSGFEWLLGVDCGSLVVVRTSQARVQAAGWEVNFFRSGVYGFGQPGGRLSSTLLGSFHCGNPFTSEDFYGLMASWVLRLPFWVLALGIGVTSWSLQHQLRRKWSRADRDARAGWLRDGG